LESIPNHLKNIRTSLVIFPETLLEKFEEGAYLDPEADELNVSDSNNNNNYIGKAQEKLEEIFRQSPSIEEEEKHLEELLSFSMKIDNSYNPFPEQKDVSPGDAQISAKERKISPRNQLLSNGVGDSTTERRVHFSEIDDHVADVFQGDGQSSSEVSPIKDYEDPDFYMENADTLHVLGELKKFSLDDDILNGFDDIVVGGKGIFLLFFQIITWTNNT
jgi:hypothetical protein